MRVTIGVKELWIMIITSFAIGGTFGLVCGLIAAWPV